MKKRINGIIAGIAAILAIMASTVAFAGEPVTPFTENRTEPGGAIYYNVEPIIDNRFTENRTEEPGGAIYYNGGPIINSEFTNNTAEPGGIIKWKGENNTSIPFVNNAAEPAGAIHHNSEPITDNQFTNNTAEPGGAIFVGRVLRSE